MSTYGWLFDPKRCLECSACEAACKQWNQVATGINVRLRRVQLYEDGVYPQSKVMALSMSCNHCENALCARACPVKAITKRADGIVIVDTDKCLGCGQCYQFCPYRAPQMDMATRKTYKCTMCADRIDAGLMPACATICPTGALQWGKWDEISAKGDARVNHFNNPALTRPHIRFASVEWEK
jgi:Fe-S-cluster-containing dehydrogenase component